MIPYKQDYKFNDLVLNDGVDKHEQTYRRDPQAQGGMAELVNIVAGLQKDVKRINQCLTLEGAQKYASKRKNWQASELDFTGPNGKPDGINEVIVTDANGNIKVINGYALAKSTYPQRKLYRTALPTREDRRRVPYGLFLENLKEIHEGFNEEGVPYYEVNLEEFGTQFTHIRPEIKPKDLFKKFIFDPVWEQNKETLKNTGLPPIALAQVSTKALTAAWNGMVKIPSLCEILNVNVDGLGQIAPKTKNKALRKPEFLVKTRQYTAGLLDTNESIAAAMNRIDNEYLGPAFAEVAAKYNYQAAAPQFSVPPNTHPPTRSAIQQSRFGETPYSRTYRQSQMEQLSRSIARQQRRLQQESQSSTEMGISELEDE